MTKKDNEKLGLFCSCSNEDELVNSLPENESQAQIMINITNNNAITRATGNTGDTDEGTESEYYVTDLAVVLTDAGNIVQSIHYPKVKAEPDNTADATIATEVFQVPAGSYKVYVLANYKDAGAAIGSPLKTGVDIASVFNISDASLLHQNKKFLMVNTNFVASTTDFSATASDTEVDSDHSTVSGGKTVHLVSVDIERVVAKVQCEQAKTSFDVNDDNNVKIATTTLDGAALINLNKKMYLIRTPAAATNKPTGISSWIYPVDPNYDTVLNGASDETTWLGNNFSNSSASSFTDFTSTPTFYCPENTMTANAQQNGQTTGVVYKVTYTPESGAYTELAKDGTSTYDQIFTAMLGLSSGKDPDITDAIFTTAGSDGTFYAYNGLIFQTKNAAVLYQCIAEATGSTTSDKASNANTNFTTNKSKTGDDLDAIKVYEYTNGASYYTAWVKHNPDGANMQQDKFGVVRNHWYILTVQSISGLGYHKPTFEDAKDPDDPAVANIQVAATIKPWTVVRQNVNL
ncbi:Mfa1 family fimbria major subunit [uncultured Bacteroides sp.]|uniref:Mfa1 family fimbria major subunit n=1 Tax=uncultured Bacteroides sp. TaxID=162156 RepID=UPI00261A3DB7|nr:Mfa1 family fimbria major subunit [uncultured Bacteroides sp.]